MLVLARKVDESIIINDNIEIKVLEIKGDQVRLGITAPQDIAVHRKEVHAAIVAENRQAAASLGNVQALQDLHLPKMMQMKKDPDKA